MVGADFRFASILLEYFYQERITVDAISNKRVNHRLLKQMEQETAQTTCAYSGWFYGPTLPQCVCVDDTYHSLHLVLWTMYYVCV